MRQGTRYSQAVPQTLFPWFAATGGRFLSVLVFMVTASAMLAQSDRGILTGIVTDPSGASIPKCVVMARDLDSDAKYNADTTSAGSYTLSNLPAGRYELDVQARGLGAETLYWHTQAFNGRARSLYDTVGQLTSHVHYERNLS